MHQLTSWAQTLAGNAAPAAGEAAKLCLMFISNLRIEDLQSGHPDFLHLSALAELAVDLRYAGPRNFVGRDVYSPHDCAWLHCKSAAGLRHAAALINQRGNGARIVVLDALRPHRVQIELWNSLAGTGLQMYLAPPERGSIHSYGMAVDVGVLDADGVELDMGTSFDEMTALSHPEFEAAHLQTGQLGATQHANRLLLRNAMTEAGFAGIATEWWHFDFGDRTQVRQSMQRVD
jgi:D-alanyl-D-alanine dipeptidase